VVGSQPNALAAFTPGEIPGTHFQRLGGILVIFINITRLASNKIFSPSNKIHWEVGWAKDLSAPQYLSLSVSQ